MRWLLFGVAGLAIVIAIVVIVGSTLPRNHIASRTARFRHSPEDVWAALTRGLDRSSVPVDTVERRPPSRLVTRVKESERNFGGTWTIEIAPGAQPSGAADGGSIVTITEDGWVANPVFRFVSRFVIGHHATIDGLLKEVAASLGEGPLALDGR